MTEIGLKTGDFREISGNPGLPIVHTSAYLDGSFEAGFAIRHPHIRIAGLGLAVGTDKENATCDVQIGVDLLRSRITFTQRKFRGFATFTGAEAQARGSDIVVEPTAPIIDSTEA